MSRDLKSYENEIEAINQELKTLPDGYLVKHGLYYFVKAGSIQKGITKDKQKLRQMARKAYLLKRLGHLEWNFSLAKKQFHRVKTEEPMSIIQELPSVYQTLPISYFFHPSVSNQLDDVAIGSIGSSANLAAANEIARNENFANGIAANGIVSKANASDKNMGFQDGRIYVTNSGIRVRSKSERIIADALDQYKITYRYEAEIALGGVSRSPDFTIYKTFDGGIVLWEHFGLMDQDGYRQKSIEKLALYERYGFFPFNNLICTFEEDLKKPARIQAIIETFLLG